jgi:hypothetical protein
MTTAIRQPRTLRSSALVAGLLVAACLAVAPSVALAVPPAPPTLTATSPASPADDTSPEVIGMAEAGSTVRIYTDPNCIAGSLVGTGSAAAFASTGITATVASNSTTTFYATATNIAAESSACSTPSSIVYVEAPSAPVVVDTDPPPPSADNTPQFRGTAEAGTTVYLYRNATCTGEFVGIGSAAAFASPGIAVTVGDNSSTTVWAKVLNGANTPSACSTTSFTYTHQLPRPPAPVFADSDPDSPANANIPYVKGSAVAGGIVRIYTNPSCNEPRASEGTSAAFASPGIQTSVVNDTTTVLYARVLDAGNTPSLCSTSSLTYVEDSTAPETTIVSGPEGAVPASTTVRFELSASEPGSRFECHLHDPGFQPCTSPATFPARATGSSASTAQLQVRAIDRAGNEDASPAARSYAIGAGAAPPPPPPAFTGCTLRTVAISGTPAANTLNGSARSDVLLGKAGNDLLRGLAGDDCLYGEAGNDRLRGGSGADRLFGGPGADRLEGEAGNDRMSGAAGNDRLTDRSGRDSFSGGIGNDTIDSRDTSLGGRRVRDTVTCGTGRDRVIADRRDAVARDCERISRR